MGGRVVALLSAACLLGNTGLIHAEAPSEVEMAARIDRHLAEAWAREGIEPVPRATDAEFLRRAWLDLCGIIPPLNDDDGLSGVHDFLADERPEKRALLIDALLAKRKHSIHLADVWKDVMLPENVNLQQFGRDTGFQTWLRQRFAVNEPYNKLVRRLIVANGDAGQPGPALFYTALELKPENLAASTSRIFLGVQIQCAQCHNHPFDHWTREDFWGYAAFFARLERPGGNQQVASQVREIPTGEVTIPETEEVVLPRFLGGAVSPDEEERTRLVRLADWLTAADNPWFARATVNRAWALLFGRGLVEPVDDLGPHNPARHPELLNELADDFVESGFDLRRLLRTLALTDAYQLSSRSTPETGERPELFAQMAVKTMTAEQLYDCLTEAMRRRETGAAATTPVFALGGADPDRQAFLARFRAPTQGATEYQGGIPQALTLMNGQVVRQATDLSQSDLLLALDAPFFTDEQRLDVLFLSTLARPPSDEERAWILEYVQAGGTKSDSLEALGDVLWALLNSAEFVLNH
jgi:Protein of unknown function (DUF1549)/Protein of unknown function (DUF1553)